MAEPEFDESLWITMGERCRGRHFILGNAHTFPGRILAWCPTKGRSFFVSKNEMESISPTAAVWISGFLSGSEPHAPENDDERPAWEAKRRTFHETGTWPAPGAESTGLEDDAERARQLGLTFAVAVEAGRGQPWRKVRESIEALRAAVQLATDERAWEAGVLTDGPSHAAGSLYWTSRHPNLWNSTVVWMSAETEGTHRR